MALRNCPIKAAIGCGKCRGYESLTDRKGSASLWTADGMTVTPGR